MLSDDFSFERLRRQAKDDRRTDVVCTDPTPFSDDETITYYSNTTTNIYCDRFKTDLLVEINIKHKSICSATNVNAVVYNWFNLTVESFSRIITGRSSVKRLAFKFSDSRQAWSFDRPICIDNGSQLLFEGKQVARVRFDFILVMIGFTGNSMRRRSLWTGVYLKSNVVRQWRREEK